MLNIFRRAMIGQRLTITLFAFAGLMTGCCGSSDRPPTVPVSGKLTFDGGPCPQPGVINFSPIAVADGMPRRPGSGHFDTDGEFQVRSFEEGDGLVPGTYSLRIDCWKRPPLGDGNPPISYIAKEYRAEELEVKLGDDGKFLELDVPLAP